MRICLRLSSISVAGGRDFGGVRRSSAGISAGPGMVRMADQLTPEKRSTLMSRVRTRGTAPELALRKALWAHGLRGWRLHPRGVPGKPDLAWIGRRVAVFVDG